MYILLGDFKLWRVKRFLLISIVLIIILCILSIINISIVGINTLIMLISLIILGFISDSKIFRKEYTTECLDKGEYIYIKNEKVNLKIYKKDISNIYYKEIVYGGRWLERIGYRLILEYKNNKYIFDSIYQKNSKWEETDLIKLYNMLRNV